MHQRNSRSRVSPQLAWVLVSDIRATPQSFSSDVLRNLGDVANRASQALSDTPSRFGLCQLVLIFHFSLYFCACILYFSRVYLFVGSILYTCMCSALMCFPFILSIVFPVFITWPTRDRSACIFFEVDIYVFYKYLFVLCHFMYVQFQWSDSVSLSTIVRLSYVLLNTE